MKAPAWLSTGSLRGLFFSAAPYARFDYRGLSRAWAAPLADGAAGAAGEPSRAAGPLGLAAALVRKIEAEQKRRDQKLLIAFADDLERVLSHQDVCTTSRTIFHGNFLQFSGNARLVDARIT